MGTVATTILGHGTWHMDNTDGSEYTSIAEVHLKIVEPMSQVLLSKLRRTSVKNSPPYL